MKKNKIILAEDPKVGGYTAYSNQFPKIIAEGDTPQEALNNLINATYDVFKSQVDGLEPIISWPTNSPIVEDFKFEVKEVFSDYENYEVDVYKGSGSKDNPDWTRSAYISRK